MPCTRHNFQWCLVDSAKVPCRFCKMNKIQKLQEAVSFLNKNSNKDASGQQKMVSFTLVFYFDGNLVICLYLSEPEFHFLFSNTFLNFQKLI